MQAPEQLAAPPEALDDDPPVTALMTPRVVAITPDSPLRTALRLMADTGVHHLPVLDGARCTGVVVEADVVRAIAVGVTSSVGALAVAVPVLAGTARRSRAAGAVLAAGGGAALVVEDHRLVGIVTTTDLVRSLADGRATAGAVR